MSKYLPVKGDGGGTTYGALTNADILLIPSPNDLETAFSTDDLIIYTFYNNKWRSTGGGPLT